MTMSPELSTKLKSLMLDVRNCEDSPYYKTLMSLRQLAAELGAMCPELKCEVEAHPKTCVLKLSRLKSRDVARYFLKFDTFDTFPMSFELAGQYYTCSDLLDFEAKVLEAMRLPASQRLLRALIFT